MSKFATRALVQSLAREFGPKGVHVSHAIIDGIIDTPGTKDYMKDAGPDAKIDPETVSICSWRGGSTVILRSLFVQEANQRLEDRRDVLVSTYPAKVGIHT